MNNTATCQDENAIITEIINGQEVLMSPRPALTHSAVAGNIHAIFRRFLRGKRCKTFMEPDVFLDENNNFVPDVLIVCERDKMKSDGIHGAPDLVVEVLSPSTATRDRGIKVDLMKDCLRRLNYPAGNQRIFETVTKATLPRALNKGAKAAGLPHIRVHDLRHSHASLLIEQGFSPLVIKERLGHESIETTLNTYSHLYPNKQSEIAERLQALVEGK